LSFSETFLHLDPTIWDLSMPSKRVASSDSTLSQSYWKYSNILFFFFFFFFFTILLFLAFSLTLASTSFLVFWATCSAQCDFTASSNWIRSCCCSLCLHYIFCHCFLSTSTLFWKILKWMGNNMVIQRKRQKNPVYILLT